MPRPLRIEYCGALYHVMSRGDGAARDGSARFSPHPRSNLSETGWQIHAWCLMSNHFHLVAETPQPNLALGMKWLLGTYTQRFNRRHRH